MRRNSKLVALGVPIAVVALGAAACGGGGSSSAQGASGPSGHKGGVLKVLAEKDPTYVDATDAYEDASYGLLRLTQRQLYSNPSSNNQSARAANVPDLADGMPTVSADSLTWTIKLKQGVKWNAPSGPRQITAADEIRGLKMICNPTKQSFGASNYFTDTIEGMSAFCDGFANVSPTDAAALKNYEEATAISGITAVNDSTLTIRLTGPTADFMHLLELPTASPRPIEAMAYLPDSPDFRQHTIADGPYQLRTYVPNKSFTFVRNPAWDSTTDTLRKGYVNEVDVTVGVDPANIQQQLQAGTADIGLGNEQPPAAALATVLRTNDPNLVINSSGGLSYLAFNMSGGGNKALGDAQVRQAINYAVNKQAISQLIGGTKVAQPTGQILNASVVGPGFKQQDPYGTPNSAGDPVKAKAMLAAAGYPDGISLTLVYRSTGNNPKIAATLQQDLKAAGITLNVKQVVDFYNFLYDTSATKSGQWDLAAPGWNPDWEGSSERSFFSPLLDGRTLPPHSSNYGLYNDPAVNTAADKALHTADQASSVAQWNAVDGQIMQDAPWVPLVITPYANYHSSRAKNFQYYFGGDNGDLTNLYVQ